LAEGKRFVVATGGTAGHVVPALLVAKELKAEGHSVVFIGADRAEKELVPEAGFELHQLRVEGVSRTNPLKAVKALGLALLALPKAVLLIRRLKPDAVLAAGGYVAGPVGLAALLLRKPVVVEEADRRLGIANRLLAPFAKKVCLAFKLPGRSSSKYRVTGRPVKVLEIDREVARKEFGFSPDRTAVLVFGGSLGARSINFAAIEGLGSIEADVLHVSGKRDFDQLTAPNKGYKIHSYLDHAQFCRALVAADLVIGRSGGSVFELAAYGCPAVLIPYPNSAGDHQVANAEWMVDAGAALMILDGELSAQLLQEVVAGLVANPKRLESMSKAALLLSQPASAQAIASELLLVVRGLK